MPAAGRSRPPHIVQIACHDLGRHLGCYGAATVRTPNLDALAAEGVRFTNAFCTAPQCSPSRSSLATGRYPHANGVMGLAHDGFGWDLHPDERHVAALLAAHGYETHLFGLQHVTMHPERLGFARIHRRGLAPDVASDVEAMLSAASPATPLYLEINLEEPHRPYDQGGVRPDATLGVAVPPWLSDTPAAREEVAALQGAIHEADRAVGRILAALDTAGLAETTLVLFTVDHGVAMPRAKCTLYDPGIGVALILRWPAGGLAGGGTIDALVSNVDVLPTLLEAAGAPGPEDLHGRSLLPLVRGERYEPRDAVFAEKTFHSYYDPMRAIRTARHTYIRNFESCFLVEGPGDVQLGGIYRTELQRYVTATHPDVELYDLDADPLEISNLAGRPETAAIERELDARLWRWMEETGDPLLNGPVPSPAYRRAMAARRRSERPI
jgi:arylsulfatase A-like enzyme